MRHEKVGSGRAQTADQATRWLQGVLAFALLHEAADPPAVRRLLRTFVLPSVFSETAPA